MNTLRLSAFISAFVLAGFTGGLQSAEAMENPILGVNPPSETSAQTDSSVSTENCNEPLGIPKLRTALMSIKLQSDAFDGTRPTFVITHGMGGTQSGDRFHQLADAICRVMPECNVLTIDWSKRSSQKGLFGVLNPFEVAKSINPVGKEASELLQSLSIDPVQTTFIGESFGNYVNAQIAAGLGGRGRILAFNPATALGGYKLPDLRACSDLAWSFHTYSIFDTQDAIADFGIFLETSPAATEVDQHIFGVSWLAERVSTGDLAWLQTTHEITACQAEFQGEHFDAIGTLTGEIQKRNVPRKRQESQDAEGKSKQLIASHSQDRFRD